MFHLYQRIKGILLKCKPRSCCFVQLPALKETRGIILLLSALVTSAGPWLEWFWMQMSLDLQVRFSPSRRTVSAFVWLGPLCAAGFVCICLSWGRDSSLGWCLSAGNFKSLLYYFHRWSRWGKCCYFCDRNVTSFQDSLFYFLLV